MTEDGSGPEGGSGPEDESGEGDENGDSSDAATDGSGAPVDFDGLDRIRERLAGDDRFERVESRPAYAPDRVVCTYDGGLYPPAISSASLAVAWFENGDFSIHYHEERESGTFDHRWDRHRSAHNSRDHVHPGPDAPTPGRDTSHPADWRDVLSTVLSEIEARQRAFWNE